MKSIQLMAATFLISVALIAYQIAIMQLLSLVQWYHFANMVISIALLGFGAAGTLLSLFREQLLRRSGQLLPLLMILSGLGMIIATWLSRSGFARFDSYLLFIDRSQWVALAFNYLLFFLPFFFGALALGIIFIKDVANIGKFYFSNLIGSGVGAPLAIWLSWQLLPATLPVLIAFISIASGLILCVKENKWPVLTSAFLVSVLGIIKIDQPINLSPSEYKALSKTLNLPGAKVELKKASPYGLVEVVSAKALRYAPGLSFAFKGEIPVKKVIFNNGDWYGPIVPSSQGSHLLDYTTQELPYFLGKKKNKVLILHSGSGLSISHALSNGATQIDAVESHQAVVELLKTDLAKDNDSLFYHPFVKMHVTEPRTFLSASKNKYDLIELPIIGAFGGTSGLYAMREEYSLTKEAFLQMWHLLDTNGIISVTTWMDFPFRNPLKLTATLAEVAEDAGVADLGLHLLGVRSWGTATYLLKKSPINISDIIRTRIFCEINYFDPLIMPGLMMGDRSYFNEMSDTSFFEYTDELLSKKREHLYKTYDFHLRPATDDKPYFSQFMRSKSLSHLSELFGARTVPFLELGWIISAFTFIQITLLAIVLILIPSLN